MEKDEGDVPPTMMKSYVSAMIPGKSRAIHFPALRSTYNVVQYLIQHDLFQ